MHLPFALSPSHFISNVGSDAGFAALIGLALLALLYFAHAREASSLREQLAAALQRIEALERRLMSGTVSPPVPVPKPPVATPAVAAAGPAAGPPGVAPVRATPVTAPAAAPAGVAAPALIDATRVVPAFEQVAAGADETDGHKEPVPARALSAPGGTGTIAPPPPTMAPPTVAAPGLPGASGPAQPAAGKTPAPVTSAAGGNGSAPVGSDPGLTPGSLLREGLPGQRRRRSLRFLVPVVVALGAVAAAVVVVVLLTSNGSTQKTAHHHASSSQMTLALHKVAPSSVTVAVVNGTTVNQLAHHTAQRLTAKGFKQGQLATASNQSVKTTLVGYLPGHRLDALVVAHALKLTAAAVAPVQAASRALACPGTAPCTAEVIVTVGTDLAHAT